MGNSDRPKKLGTNYKRSAIRPVSRIMATVTDKKAFETCIDLCVDWMSQKSIVSFPEKARVGESFDISDQLMAIPCRAIRFENDGEQIWAARLDHPDSAILHRSWVTEFLISNRPGDVTRFGVQLSCISRGENPPVFATRPTVVRDIITKLSAEVDGWELSEEPITLDDSRVPEFENLLYNSARRLPVIAASENVAGLSVVDLRRITNRLAGAAHIVRIPDATTWELTRALGRQMSVFSGALRVYMPGLTEENEDPFQHPLWRLTDAGPRSDLVGILAGRLLPLAFLREAEGIEFPRFSAIKEMALQIAAQRVPVTSEVELLRQEIFALKQRSVVLEEEKNTWEALAQEQQEMYFEAEVEVEKLEEEIDRQKAKSVALAHALEARGGHQSPDLKGDRHLESYEELDEWARDVLGPKVVIHRSALKDCRKNGHDSMLRRIEDVLIIIRDFVAPAKLEGGYERQESAKLKLAEIAMDDSSCFADRDEAKRTTGYSVRYQGEERVLYDHIKYGNGYDNANQIRIYYFIDGVQKKFIVGKMPSHLRNNLTS